MAWASIMLKAVFFKVQEMKRKLIIWLSILIVVIVAASIWGYESSREPLVKLSPIPVKVSQVALKHYPEFIQAIGTVIAPRDISLMAKQPGLITKINFEPGEKVEKGRLLFAINDIQQQAVLLQKQATLTSAQAEFNRYAKLKGEPGEIVSPQQYDLEKANFLAAKGAYEAAQKDVDDTRILAPFAGTISDTRAVETDNGNSFNSLKDVTQLSVGSYVKVGQVLAELVDRQHLLMQYTLPQSLLGQTKIGQKVELSTSSYPNEIFPGKVIYRSPTVNSTTRTFKVLTTIVNHEERLSPGMMMAVKQVVNPSREMLVIPAISLVPTIEGYQVYEIEDGKVTAKNVTVGAHYGDEVEVTKGLKSGDTVISAGMNKVVEGDHVTVVK